MKSEVFDNFGRHNDDARILLDQIHARERPPGSCRDQLLHPDLVALLPMLPEMVGSQDAAGAVRIDRHLCAF